MTGWSDMHGPEVEAQLRMEVDDLKVAYDHLWHRYGDLKRETQQCLTRFDTGRRTRDACAQLAEDLQKMLAAFGERVPRLPAPHELRLKHMQQRRDIDAAPGPARR